MFGSSKKPYTAISVQIDRMTDEDHGDDDLSGIIDLVEVIRLQQSGPTEAARAIRKKLKYGGPHQQVRALTILDGLIQNAGSRFQTTFADEPLLERLRLMARDETVDAKVRQKCSILFRHWTIAYQNTAGLNQIAALSGQLPHTKRVPPNKYQEYEDGPSSPSASHSRNTSSNNNTPTRQKPSSSLWPTSRTSTATFDSKSTFNLEKQKPQLTQILAQSSIASTNLLNTLQLINRETQRVSDNSTVMERFATCKTLRKQVLKYIQLVESDEWIGNLLNANDELVKALTAFDIMDKSIDDDSDSDDHGARPAKQMGRMNLKDLPPREPPRPEREPRHESESEEEEDDDDPFGDSNAVRTPGTERPGMTWKTV